jgi:hypothetical protein
MSGDHPNRGFESCSTHGYVYLLVYIILSCAGRCPVIDRSAAENSSTRFLKINTTRASSHSEQSYNGYCFEILAFNTTMVICFETCYTCRRDPTVLLKLVPTAQVILLGALYSEAVSNICLDHGPVKQL